VYPSTLLKRALCWKYIVGKLTTLVGSRESGDTSSSRVGIDAVLIDGGFIEHGVIENQRAETVQILAHDIAVTVYTN
jgi:hypothetical protein